MEVVATLKNRYKGDISNGMSFLHPGSQRVITVKNIVIKQKFGAIEVWMVYKDSVFGMVEKPYLEFTTLLGNGYEEDKVNESFDN